jgi:hypothetical protein
MLGGMAREHGNERTHQKPECGSANGMPDHQAKFSHESSGQLNRSQAIFVHNA